MANEFTNMATAVIWYSELALRAIEEPHPAREWLENILNQTVQLARLVSKLMALKQRAQCGEQA